MNGTDDNRTHAPADMTLPDLVELLLEPTGDEDDVTPREVAVLVLGVLRTVYQRELCTDEGIAASLRKFEEMFGHVTRENLLEFVRPFSSAPVPWSLVHSVLGSD